ncbi:MAG: nucleotide sugar dehydrogenase [Candidatus Nanoarchaeia archaeon]|nr:nucleotide sugar dehydrogenase [Candidatus Nanoarchaeia archaeon]
MDLKQKIRDKSALIGVLGLGYVGFPLSCVIADSGFKVSGIDINKENTERINKGVSIIDEKNLPEIAKKVVENGNLVAGTDYSVLNRCDIIIICVQTPLSEGHIPLYEFLKSACESVSSAIGENALVIIESTIAPGTTDNIIKPILDKSKKIYFLAHSPERVLPGNLIHELINNDRIIGGVDVESTELAKEFYSTFVKGHVISTSAKVAEMTKVAENTYRDVNIAYANELALVCEELGINVYEVIKYANMHPRVNILSPGCGVGGHCIPKDPWLLASSSKRDIRLVEEARRLNEFMIKRMFHLMKTAEHRKKIDVGKVAIFGLTYKGDIKDTRQASGIKLKNELIENGIKEICTYDPYIESDSFNHSLENADVLFICTEHKEFNKWDSNKLNEIKNLMRNPIIIDGRNVVDKKLAEEAGFLYMGIGNI